MAKFKILLKGRGYGRSLGNMLEVLSGEAAEKQEGNWIEVEQKGRVFTVVDENMTDKDGDWIVDSTALGFSSWDAEVKDLDNDQSDASQCFGISMHLKWKDVDMTPDEFRAPSIERLKEALNHVAICAWCPGDI
jgi:hypothetical protein